MCRSVAYDDHMSNETVITGYTISDNLKYKGIDIAAFTNVAVYRESENGEADNGGYLFHAVAPNLWAPSIVETSCVIPELGVRVEADLQLNTFATPKYDVWKYAFSSYFAEPVSMATINKVPLDVVAHANLPLLHGYSGEEVSALLNWGRVLESVPFGELREKVGFDEVLKWALRIYAVASVSGDPPTKTVSETFGVPLRTASYWVKKAKAKFEHELRHDARVLYPNSTDANYFDVDNADTRAATDWFIDIAYKQPMKGGE